MGMRHLYATGNSFRARPPPKQLALGSRPSPGNRVRRAVCADPYVRHYTMRRARLLMRKRFLVLRREYARPNV